MNAPGSGDMSPEGRSHDPVPGLPPEWGEIVIPDDPAELAEEAAAVRHELGFPARAGVRTPASRRGATTALAALRPVVLTMAVAMLTMLVSLLVAAWPGGPRQPPLQRPTATGGAGAASGGWAGRSLPALDLIDARGDTVPLRGLLPAAIIVLDECTCAEQIRAIAGAAPPGVTVVAVTTGRTVPQRVATPGVRALADPASEVRGLLPPGEARGTARALLVTRSGTIAATLTGLDNPDLYRSELTALASS